MPEGYYKVQEKEQRFNYSIPPEMPIKESQRIAIETLDGIIAEKFGFHILEALVTYESHYKVKPRIKHSAAPKPQQQAESALTYMKPIEKKPFIRGQSALKQPQTTSAPVLLTPITLDNQVKDPYIRPKLGVDLKLQVIAYQNRRPPIEKQLIQDTAEFLEELLTAVDQGLIALPERQKNKPELRNKAIEDKDLKIKQDNDLYKQKEDLRKKRHTLLQQELERKKQEKLKQEEELKSSKLEIDKESKQKEQREKSVARQKLEAKRKMIEEAKRQKQEEKDAKLREEEEKKNREKAERVAQQKEFFKKQKEQLEAEFVKRRQEQEEANRIKTEMEEIKKQQQENHKNKMVEHLKQNKDQNRNEQAEWLSIGEFYQEVQASVFPKYEKAMGIMFKHYASMDKKDMAQQGMQRINLNEFSKFGLQTKITPKVISNDDLTFIFRALIRERTSTMTQKELDFLGMGVNSLGIEDFKKALIRIAILGQQKLSEGESLTNLLPHLAQDPNSKITAPSTIRAPRNIRIRGRSQVNSQASQRQLQHQNSNTDLQQEGSLEKNPNTKRTSLAARKTKEQRQIEELTKAKERQEKMMNMRIEDKRLTKGFDVSLINSDTIEALIQYMQLQPNKNMQFQMGDAQNLEYADQEEKGEEENQDEMQGNGQDQNYIEGVDMEELERQEDGYQEDIIAPDGKQENWKVAE